MSDDDRRSPTPPRKRRKINSNSNLPAKPPAPSNRLPALPPTPPLPTSQTGSYAPQQLNVAQPQIFRFPIEPLNRFQGTSTTIKRPREIAHFSYNENHEYRQDESGICYYHIPEMGADLCEGFDTFRHYEDKEDPHLDSLLKALVAKEKETGEKLEADFVTWRGMMTKIMTAPYDMFAEFNMLATLYDNTIFIEEDFSAKSAERAAEASQSSHSRTASRPPHPDQPSREMMTYWGYKFETLCMLPEPVTPSTPREVLAARRTAPVSNYAQHCSIVRTGIGSHTLILGGEVDGLLAPKTPSTSTSAADAPPIPWVELKTSEQLPPHPTRRDLVRYERKLLKFWAQSFLLGVEKVVVGFRSKAGILKGLDVYETARIPGMVRRGTRCWDGNVCVNFAAGFLGWLRGVVLEEAGRGGGGVWRVRLRRRGGVVEVQRVEGSFGEGKGRMGGIVSREFLEWREGGRGGGGGCEGRGEGRRGSGEYGEDGGGTITGREGHWSLKIVNVHVVLDDVCRMTNIP
ncbi:RAI1-domain-containing protein [Westerdykella ornata]|uniref:Decapping nuclease n=1 Tax=Westerdykella ornata TaxID=318751 RepID=A0A6A6JB19_WESOR|nr:RAI1-domain-containing protein [Westerdykella ornata]KAF2273178.1 RAI1-domain-containing protein [Westerdykella ornata]